jgi:DNA/RNA endonuclease G (NUC1)
MAPNADFNDTHENALLTFFIANVWPQTPEVNRRTWLQTENETRRLAIQYLIIRVIIVVDEFADSQINGIRIPLNLKKMVYDEDSGELVYQVIVYQ